jgi:hypothetical protein
MMDTVVLYTNNGQESERIQQLLTSVGGEFHIYTLDEDFTQDQFCKEFGVSAEYPQVAIGYNHIGGLKETLHYLTDEGLIK